MSIFEWPVKVYYEDTDAGGVVYYANYLRYLERARTEWLRQLGFEQDRLMRDVGIVFAVRHVEIDYRSPARLDDALVVEAQIAELGKASLLFRQRLLRDDAVLSTATVKVVCLNHKTFRPVAIPTTVRDRIHAYQ